MKTFLEVVVTVLGVLGMCCMALGLITGVVLMHLTIPLFVSLLVEGILLVGGSYALFRIMEEWD